MRRFRFPWMLIKQIPSWVVKGWNHPFKDTRIILEQQGDLHYLTKHQLAPVIAEAAEKGDMVSAARHYGDMTAGCVACHMHFRGQPGATVYTPRLKQ